MTHKKKTFKKYWFLTSGTVQTLKKKKKNTANKAAIYKVYFWAARRPDISLRHKKCIMDISIVLEKFYIYLIKLSPRLNKINFSVRNYKFLRFDTQVLNTAGANSHQYIWIEMFALFN